jgi:hypothetical protein
MLGVRISQIEGKRLNCVSVDVFARITYVCSQQSVCGLYSDLDAFFETLVSALFEIPQQWNIFLLSDYAVCVNKGVGINGSQVVSLLNGFGVSLAKSCFFLSFH